MRLFVPAFLCGVLWIQNFQHLPKIYFLIIMLTCTFVIYCRVRKKIIVLVLAFICGAIWTVLIADSRLHHCLPAALEGQKLHVIGYVASIPEVGAYGYSFLFKLTQINEKNTTGLIKLSWANKSESLHVGEKWSLYVKLKRIHGTMTTGSFDYEAYALTTGLSGSGSVINKMQNRRIDQDYYLYFIDHLREKIQKKMRENIAASKTSKWLYALTIGERNDIPNEEWEVLRNTGTNHLMAIAGLHIGFMALIGNFLGTLMWKQFPRLTLSISSTQIGVVASLIVALIYSVMAGFSIPTQRACLMLLVFLCSVLLRRKLLSWQAWHLALFCVLIVNPLDVLTESFWLSFGSVALIIYGVSGRLNAKGLWWKWGRLQWVIAVGLMPLSIWLFHQFSLVSFIANSVAIPLVGFLVVPLCFFGTGLLFLFPQGGALLLYFADKILSLVWWILNFLSHLPFVVWYQYVPTWMILTASIGIILILLPRGFPGRYLGFIWLLPIICFKFASPQEGELRLSLLDVGQGLSTVIQTKNHTLLFDAGARSITGFDMGNNVVFPFLASRGIKKIDTVIVSHGDNDHFGGINYILQHIPVLKKFTSEPTLMPNAQTCIAGINWEWDNVKFEFLYPTKDNLGLNNDSSCVLRITNGEKHILLTGDIEEYAEQFLVDKDANKLAADILIAPHHGSKTSALPAFVNSVHPSYVLYAIGYRNRYHFPNALVMNAYQTIHSKQFDTAQKGEISFHIYQDAIKEPSFYRVEHKHYWNIF